MKRAIAALALCLIATSAHAGKVALIYEANLGHSRNPNYAVTEDLLTRGGQQFDRFNAGTRTWNIAGTGTKADSTWFRENYDAILIPWLDGGESGVGLTASWGAKFLNASGSAGIQRSPLSGHWGIPVYVLGFASISFANSGTDETQDVWVPGGARIYGGGALFNRPSQANRGTWGYKMLCRFRGDNNDTLYTDASQMMCLTHSWPGNGSIAALVWADTAMGGLSGSCAGDTSVSMWRFRPVAGMPGITYSVLPITRWGTISGVLASLQMAYSQTPARPARRIEIPIEPHNSYGGTTDRAVAVQHVKAINDTLRAYGIVPTLALAQLNATDYTNPHDTDTRAELSRMVSKGSTWQPGSNSSGFGLAFYSASDTAQVAIAFNSVMNTATNSDSFALPASKMVKRFVPAAGLAGAWTSKVLADAGIVTAVSTLSAASTDGWSLVTGSSQADPPVRFPIPGPDETRSLLVTGTIGWTDGATFAAVRGATTECDYVGAEVALRIDWAAQTYKSLYWHMSTNTTGADGYWRWFASVIGQHFRYFDRVIAPGLSQ